MIKKIARFIQPAGFAFLLIYLIFSQYPFAKTIFWVGLLFSLIGAVFEVLFFIKTPRNKRGQSAFIFGFGAVVKTLLILGLALRVYDIKYSVYILLGSIILAFVWGILSFIFKPTADGNDDILDAT
jgi:hypothetical protein